MKSSNECSGSIDATLIVTHCCYSFVNNRLAIGRRQKYIQNNDDWDQLSFALICQYIESLNKITNIVGQNSTDLDRLECGLGKPALNKISSIRRSSPRLSDQKYGLCHRYFEHTVILMTKLFILV